MTVFIDSLSDEDRTRVLRLSLGDSRPSYYNAVIARNSNDTGEVQISLDMEAVIILSPAVSIKYILDFLSTAIDVASSLNENDYLLMKEVVGIRGESYAQTVSDVSGPIRDFENIRRGFQATIAQRTEASIDVPDLGVVFSVLNETHSALSTPDSLAVHDRIADSGVIYDLEASSTERVRELKSWSDVFRTYYVR